MQVGVAKAPVANAHPHHPSAIPERRSDDPKRDVIQPIAIIFGIGGTLGHMR